MPLPSTGSIAMSDVNVEIRRPSSQTLNLGDTEVRKLFEKTTGSVNLASGRGKSYLYELFLNSNAINVNARTVAISQGWNQVSPLKIIISSGVYIYSESTSSPALTISGSFPGGVTLVNNGFIIGMGGRGGGPASDPGYINTQGWSGNSGGPAISLGANVTIENNSYIAGGGGGSAGVTISGSTTTTLGGAGGAGGGSAAPNILVNLGVYPGGAGGGPGSSGANGAVQVGNNGVIGAFQFNNSIGFRSGGGGRILPGVGGAGHFGTNPAYGGGAGGGGGMNVMWGFAPFNPSVPAIRGYSRTGGGGGWGAAGGSAFAGATTSGAGGSSNNPGESAAGGNFVAGGGSGGAAVLLNGFTITWTAFGTRWGSIS
jgi:hypothetical protein